VDVDTIIDDLFEQLTGNLWTLPGDAVKIFDDQYRSGFDRTGFNLSQKMTKRTFGDVPARISAKPFVGTGSVELKMFKMSGVVLGRQL
jgi:hypothetical protein